MNDAHHPTLRAVLASALISTALTLPVSGALAQMSDMKKMPGMNDSKMSDTKKTKTADATGTITALNAANHKITFDHGPIPAIDWPAMKMEFAVAPSVDLAKLKTGDKVKFTLSGSGSTYTVQSIIPAP
ncbi:MAG: copper-binding protein [Afipia sp.]|nr:copper-binding protein [Afipia sp.]